jgi:hypothetical protein
MYQAILLYKLERLPFERWLGGVGLSDLNTLSEIQTFASLVAPRILGVTSSAQEKINKKSE